MAVPILGGTLGQPFSGAAKAPAAALAAAIAVPGTAALAIPVAGAVLRRWAGGQHGTAQAPKSQKYQCEEQHRFFHGISSLQTGQKVSMYYSTTTAREGENQKCKNS